MTRRDAPPPDAVISYARYSCDQQNPL
ncbi:hypothetical protein LCGC14_2649430, partial [marine sediment metagenome]